MQRKVSWHVSFVALLSIGLSAATWSAPLAAKPVAIPHGESAGYEFTVNDPGRPVVLLLRGKISLDEGEQFGAHCLQVKFNGDSIDPDRVAVLNKKVIYDRVDPNSEHPSGTVAVELFDPATGGWYLKADSDYVLFNVRDPESDYYSPDALSGSSWWHTQYKCQAAFGSHYYEYVLEIPADLVEEQNVVELAAVLPEKYRDMEVEIDHLHAVSAGRRVVASSVEWENIVFPWQAPAVDHLLGAGRSIRVAGARGQWRAATLSLYGLEDLDQVRVELPHLEQADGPGRIENPNINIYRVDTLERRSLGEAGFIPGLPFVPEDEKRSSPELLCPIEPTTYGFANPDYEHFEVAEPPSISRHRTRRYFIDVKIPGDAPSGAYQGTITVSAGDESLLDVPLELEVYPFDLAQPRQRYVVWRLTWSALWEPPNVANLELIREAGFDNMGLPRGPSFSYSVNEEGKIDIDASGYRRQVKVLREAGLEPTLRAQTSGLRAALKAAGVNELVRKRIARIRDRMHELAPDASDEAAPDKEEADVDALMGEVTEGREPGAEERQKELKHLAELLEQLKPVRDGMGRGQEFVTFFAAYGNDKIRWELVENPDMRTMKDLPPPALVDEELPDGLTVSKLLQEVNRHVEGALEQVKRIAEEEKAKLYIFPVDEPDGTPWRRAWTRWLVARAHAVGLETWSTHNGEHKWQPGIDVSAPGTKISRMYTAYRGYRPWRKHEVSEEVARWYRENTESNYMQVRSMPPNNYRPKMGLMAWSYYNLFEITAFCYDWNFNHLYSVYPKDGERGAKVWYPTLGWRGTREGITDARYLRTLELLYQKKRGMDEMEAHRAVEQALGEIDDASSYGNINRVPEYYGSFDAMRRSIAETIMELTNEP